MESKRRANRKGLEPDEVAVELVRRSRENVGPRLGKGLLRVGPVARRRGRH